MPRKYTATDLYLSTNSRIRLKAELDRANQEIALLREEMRIKDARMARIDPHRRPHHPLVERMAIMQRFRAAGSTLPGKASRMLMDRASLLLFNNGSEPG